MQKNAKKCIFWKSDEKEREKCGGTMKKDEQFKSYGEMKILGRLRQFLDITSPIFSEISHFPGSNDCPIL